MDELVFKRSALDSAAVGRALERMSLEIVERNQGTEDLALVGIHTGGVPLARRLQDRIRHHTGVEVPVGMVDITLYRDDVFIGLPQPIVGETELPFAVTGQRIVLVDDVLFTGRTIRAALDAVVDFGRPKRVQLAVLVDRGHREFPIQADFVGKALQTTPSESVRVELTELDCVEDRVRIMEKARR